MSTVFIVKLFKLNDKNNNIDETIVRFLQGTSTEDETEQFFSWLNDNSENSSSFFQMKEIYDSRKRISVSVEQQSKRILPVRRLNMLFASSWMRYAAIIVIALGITFVWRLLQPKQAIAANTVVYIRQVVIHNTRGVYQVTLPDGSNVWLHSATTLTYPEQFTDSIRMVDLQGEAYFAVMADERYPFVVQTQTAKVRATGTEFNITAYPDDQVTTTTLVKGVVAIQPNHIKESIRLKPGQQAVASVIEKQVNVSTIAEKTSDNNKVPQTLQIQEINAELYTGWKDGVYRFKNEPFENIVFRLEKMYGVDIVIECESLKSAAFSGLFTTDYSLKEVFEIINISNPVSYTVKNKVIYIRNKEN